MTELIISSDNEFHIGWVCGLLGIDRHDQAGCSWREGREMAIQTIAMGVTMNELHDTVRRMEALKQLSFELFANRT